MSASKFSGVMAISLSAAPTAASSGNAPVPPRSDSRSSASAEYPLAARRPATSRMWSVSPRFSWMTSTPPFERSAGAHAPMSVLRGPANVISSVATGAHSVVRPPPSCRARGARGALAACAARVSIAVAADAVTPSSPSRRMASRRVMMPSAWSSATSSARYRCNSVNVPSSLAA
jgi:hypothetical protein